MTEPLLIGREAETEAISRLLDETRSGRSGTLVFTGEAGSGKSALLASAEARAHGIRVLRTAGVESEAEIEFAGLHQLLHPLRGLIGSLPAAQAAALQAAFGLGEQRGADRFLIGLSVLSLLSDAAEDRPLLCLVDDADWLDQESAAALAFAARRLDAESAVMLLAARTTGGTPFAGLPTWPLGPIGPEQAKLLLARHYPDLDPLVRDRVIARAAGNPLALIELPKKLHTGQEPGAPPSVALALTAVEAQYLDQIRALPDATQLLLLLAAAEDSEALGLVLRASRTLGVPPEALEPAERAGIVAVEQDRVRFVHPLARSATYNGATFSQRRRAHQALADASSLEEPDRRAWHHAAAAVAPDEEAARELEATAGRARLRSGQAAASAALERAAQLSGGPQTRAARLVAAAQAAWRAGNGGRAMALIEHAAPLTGQSQLRATAAEVQGLALAQQGPAREAAAALATAASEFVPIDRPRAIRLAAVASEIAWFGYDAELLRQLETLVTALPAEDGVAGQFMHAYVRALAVTLRAGLPAAVAPLRDAVGHASGLADPRPLTWAADCAMLLGDVRAALDRYSRAVTRSRQLAMAGDLVHALHLRARCEFDLGKIAVAAADASEALRLGREMMEPGVESHSLSLLARVAALRGDAEECRRHAAATLERAVPNCLELAVAQAVLAQAELEIGLGRASEAVERLEPLVVNCEAHPAFLIDMAVILVEAAVRARTPDPGQSALALCELWVAGLDAPGLHAKLARCRGLLASDPPASKHFAEALRLHGEQGNPLDRARTQLCFGEQLRRAGRRAEARPQLRAALQVFDSLGASLLARRAAAELRATGETVRRRAPAATELTAQELQIARLAAAGGSNREVAARLYVSPKTVEYHLHKVFAKLGVASRAGLAQAMAQAGLAGGRRRGRN
jgi:DNA-binding CsgD family transcriptional regulator